MIEITKKTLHWLIPCGLYEIYRKLKDPVPRENLEALSLVASNAKFHDIHKGKRCFIVCNGPSINEQNLLPLENEHVFSVSNGYLHKDYQTYKPQYHCVPQFTYTRLFTIDTAARWFCEMEKYVTNAELFLSYTEYEMVKEHGFFANQKVSYVYFNEHWEDQTNIIDITKGIPRVQSVPIMVLIIAMYMGFEKIYLVGTEHDSFRTGNYKYFYEPTVLANTGFNVENNDKVKSLYEELRGSTILWEQYRALKKIALTNDIRIYNATHGGALDEFERFELDEILGSGTVERHSDDRI